MFLHFLIALAVLSSVPPAALFFANLQRYRAPLEERRRVLRPRNNEHSPAVSVLIPARNEEANIRACLAHVCASTAIDFEVIVLDDSSSDGTAAIVQELATHSPALTLVYGKPLPPGWNGKQHACWVLAQQARGGVLLFLDADVRVAPETIARCLTTMRRSGVDLLSGFPRQITVGWMEQLLLPLIHFVLLSFLPLGRMRRSTSPAYSAGCGQFVMVAKAPYFFSGGHLANPATRHDGLKLPQALRRKGLRTDLVDLTGFAEVRMYASTSEVWQGLAKNATEGMATPRRIGPFTLILLFGQVLPLVVAICWCVQAPLATVAKGFTGTTVRSGYDVLAMFAVWLALIASYLPRLAAALRFRQSVPSALLHPLGILTLLALQWYALVCQLRHKPVGWRARSYSSANGEEVF